jgi:hypothetical protein
MVFAREEPLQAPGRDVQGNALGVRAGPRGLQHVFVNVGREYLHAARRLRCGNLLGEAQ